jgi:hypothetical protein
MNMNFVYVNKKIFLKMYLIEYTLEKKNFTLPEKDDELDNLLFIFISLLIYIFI